MVMFSGLVCVGMLTAFGSCTGTVLVITGIVIRKMISSTSMTSTNGVVLMVAIALCSPEAGPTLIDIAGYSGLLAERRGLGRCRTGPTGHSRAGVDAHATHQIGMQIAREVPHHVLQHLGAAEQQVVAPYRWHRDEQTERRHDERRAHGAGHLVDARLAGKAD